MRSREYLYKRFLALPPPCIERFHFVNNVFAIGCITKLIKAAICEFEGRKEMFYLTTHSTHSLTVIWRQAYGKGPLRQRERKPAAAT